MGRGTEHHNGLLHGKCETFNEDGTIIDSTEMVFQPAFPVRVKSESIFAGSLDGIPLIRTIWGHVEGLPDSQEDVFYIVSQLVKDRLPDRTDLLVPADIVRNEKGQIIGCKSFSV